MILTLDIGNTNIKTALFDGKEMRYYWRMSTNIQKSSDEYGIVLVNLCLLYTSPSPRAS